MANIVFIALQCCQCSTMQVKQQKKSSNKWTCAVCNEKQSVRKVFARGFMAKDIRKFVQSFNMSRCFAEQEFTVDCDARSTEIEQEENQEKIKKRRVDWNEYLDKDVVVHRDEEAELEPKIVTEWPDEQLKGTKLKVKSRDSSHGQSEASYKPVFSKRNRDSVRQGKDLRGQPIKSSDKSTGERSIDGRENQQLAKSAPMAKFGASKWDQYMDENDGYQCLTAREHVSKAAADQEFDLEVEEDIHPDFL